MTEALWQQFAIATVATEGLILDLPQSGHTLPTATVMPALPVLTMRAPDRTDYGAKDLRQGFAVDLWFRLDSLAPGQSLLDNRTENGQGFCLQITDRETVEIVLNDGRTENRWDCDPGLLQIGQSHHLAVSVDGGPKIITFVVDGVLCDGGDFRQFGWGRYSPYLRGANGADILRIGPSLQGKVAALRVYDRALHTTEAIGNFRAGM